ncbi:hypothetical protein BOFL111202_08390 [Bordetella flabilis]
MRRTTGAICAFAVFLLQAALQSSYAASANATFNWVNRTKHSMYVKVNSQNSCALSYGTKNFTLKPGGSYSLQVMYLAGCSSLQLAWDVSGGGSKRPFSGTLTYKHNYPDPKTRTTAGVGIDYSAQLKGASFRIACGNNQVICYRPNKIAAVIARGPGASIDLLSDAVFGMELFGGTSPIRQGL